MTSWAVPLAAVVVHRRETTHPEVVRQLARAGHIPDRQVRDLANVDRASSVGLARARIYFLAKYSGHADADRRGLDRVGR